MAYPSINFSTTKRFAASTPKAWRDTIAVVGEFNQGPAEALSVTPEQFELLYGADSSEGSVNVQQLLDLGATNLYISRAVPEDSSSFATINIASGNTEFVEPVVGYEVDTAEFNPFIDESNYTCGVSLSANFIGEAFVTRSIYSPVTAKASTINHTSLISTSEQGVFNFVVTAFVAGASVPEVKHDDTKSIEAATLVGSAGGMQVLVISTATGDNADYAGVDQAIRPGYVFKTDDVTPQLLTILTKPYAVGLEKVAVLVQNLTSSTAGTKTLQVVDPVKDTYVMGYRLDLQQSNTLTPQAADSKYFSVPNAAYSDAFSQVSLDSFFSLEADKAGVPVPFKFQYVADDVVTTASYTVSTEGLNSAPDEGIVLVFGEEGRTGQIPLLIGGSFGVPFATGYVTAGSDDWESVNAYAPGVTGKVILNDLYQEIMSNSTFRQLIEDVDNVTAFYPYSMKLTSSLKGLGANRINLEITKHVKGTLTEASDLYFDVGKGYTHNFTVAGSNKLRMMGAISGPRIAFRDFYSIDGTPILRVAALSPGEADIRVSVVPQNTVNRESTKFLLNVEARANGVVQSEVFNLDTKSVNNSNGLFSQSADSFYVRAFFLPYLEGYVSPSTTSSALNDLLTKLPVRSDPPFRVYSDNFGGTFNLQSFGASQITRLPLLNGRSFTQESPPLSRNEVRKLAYMAAVDRLKDIDAAFVIITGITYGDPLYAEVFDLAIRQTSGASVETGLRQLFLETPLNMSPRQAETLSLSINNRYVSLVNGHIVQRLANGTFFRNSGVLGYYAAMIATRPPFVAPHAPSTEQLAMQIVSADVRNSPDYKSQLSLGRVESIYFDNRLASWKFLNGLTTATEPTDRYVSVNRIRIQIISDLYDYLQWVRSQPNNRALQNQVTTAVDAYMQTKLQQGWLVRLGDTICGPENNSESDMVQGRLNIQISYVPVVPADFIFVNLIEDYTLIDDLTINTASN